MRRDRLATLLGAALLASVAAAAPRDARVPGGIAVLDLGSAASARPEARFRGQPVLVQQRGDRWQALVGLPLDLAAGPQQLDIDAAAPLAFTVAAKHYPEQRLRVADSSKVELSPADAARVEREAAVLQPLKMHWRDSSTVDVDLVPPVNGRRSGRFGARRSFNGQPRAPHAGLDLAVARGTPVRAGAAATVLATGDYFFTGLTVFLDHGQGLVTLLCHLDRIDVRAGDSVGRDQVIGRSGMSGRASGPHLHWGVALNGALVDPELFLAARRR